MQLIVAEKPSVARDLARVLGVRPTGQHGFEGDGCVITWCVGHLVELDEPAAYDGRWKASRLDTLPMVPAAFRLRAARRGAAARGGEAPRRPAVHHGRQRLRRRARRRADLWEIFGTTSR